jgi:hypothetical protein
MHRTLPLAAALFSMAVAACGPATSSPSASSAPPASHGSSPGIGATPPAVETLEPSQTPGIAFDPESIVGYYQSIGYACTDVLPSRQAVGYTYRTCSLVDAAGRTRSVGMVTNPSGDVGDAFASVIGAAGEDILDPNVALDPFAAFLGAILGGAQGEAILPWLAGHLGNSYATTSLGDMTIATYTISPEDHSELYLEIATRAYLDAPRPSEPPAPS